MTFVGADVGGFFKNVETELMVRWYQAGAYQPFFRSHAHLDTKRREPWLFDDTATALIRDAIHARYTLLYYWYTQFYLNEKTGRPPMVPLWVNFPNDTTLFGVDDEYMIGSSLLVKPITTPGATSIDVLFPGDETELWYDVKSMRSYQGGSTKTFTDISLATIPVYQRGGSIVPYKFRLRRSSTQMADDPFTLIVTLDSKGQAEGELYFDDSKSYNYRNKKEFVHRRFVLQDNVLQSINLDKESKFDSLAWIERVIVYGVTASPKSVRIEYDNKEQSAELQFTYDQTNKALLVRKPGVKINVDWKLVF